MSNLVRIRHAMAAVTAGMCSVAVVSYGSTARDLAEIAVAARRWAQPNPKNPPAWRRSWPRRCGRIRCASVTAAWSPRAAGRWGYGVQIDEHFTIGVLQSLEEQGFCQRAEGGACVADAALGPGGRFPINTSGGGLCRGKVYPFTINCRAPNAF